MTLLLIVAISWSVFLFLPFDIVTASSQVYKVVKFLFSLTLTSDTIRIYA